MRKEDVEHARTCTNRLFSLGPPHFISPGSAVAKLTCEKTRCTAAAENGGDSS